VLSYVYFGTKMPTFEPGSRKVDSMWLKVRERIEICPTDLPGSSNAC
jgi:hypothetical protein